MGRQLIIEARRRAGITQRELAYRLGTHQPVVARWEKGTTEPSLRNVIRAVRACGLDLNISVTERDDHDLVLIRRELRVLPHERLSRMVDAVNAFASMEIAAHG
ncbi:MAG: helix-turn-helix transcriptional regulator [Actinomycetota bacterium]|nr:helix-turn-helix transcriptional regulator [Actinomycetota bacterium]